jgi:hypothetical protein
MAQGGHVKKKSQYVVIKNQLKHNMLCTEPWESCESEGDKAR